MKKRKSSGLKSQTRVAILENPNMTYSSLRGSVVTLAIRRFGAYGELSAALVESTECWEVAVVLDEMRSSCLASIGAEYHQLATEIDEFMDAYKLNAR
jgi:hypothetical protein